MEITHNSIPGDSFGGFYAYGGIRPGRLGRTFLAANSEATRFAAGCAPCFCYCTGVHEAKETHSASPGFCLCSPVHEGEEMPAASPCFCFCGGANEAKEMSSAAPGFCLCHPAHEGNA